MSETMEANAPVETPEAQADDLRSVLGAAFKEHSAEPRDRDERGRFAAREPAHDAGTEQHTDQPEGQAGEQPEAAAIEPPTSWSDAEKQHWTGLSREAQDAILRRERDMDKALADRAGEAKAFEPLRDVLAPYQAKHAMMGLSDAEAVGRLLKAQEALERDPDKAFPELARAFSYDLRRLFPNQTQPTQTQPQQQQFRDPRVDDLLAHQEREQHAAAARQVEAFGKDPAHPHFEDVRAHMGRLVQADPGLSLKDAYEQAVWANPVTREKLLTAQRQADEAKRAKEAKDRAEAARRAGSSVRSAAPAGSVINAPAGSLREEIERAIRNP